MKKKGDTVIIAQIYVDDIVFGRMSVKMEDHFVQHTQAVFEMSMVRELSYFLGFQIKQIEDGIFISQRKYEKKHFEKAWA